MWVISIQPVSVDCTFVFLLKPWQSYTAHSHGNSSYHRPPLERKIAPPPYCPELALCDFALFLHPKISYVTPILIASATWSGHCNEVSFYFIISGMLCRRLPKVGESALALYRAPRTLLVRRINFLLKFVTSQIRHATLLLWGDYPNLPNFKRWCNEKYLS